jgi:hypothetical protein
MASATRTRSERFMVSPFRSKRCLDDRVARTALRIHDATIELRLKISTGA